VRIGHQSDVHVRVPEGLGYRDDIHSGPEQVAREGVAQIVESYPTNSRPAQGGMQAGV
jgi:hypothetical protein